MYTHEKVDLSHHASGDIDWVGMLKVKLEYYKRVKRSNGVVSEVSQTELRETPNGEVTMAMFTSEW